MEQSTQDPRLVAAAAAVRQRAAPTGPRPDPGGDVDLSSEGTPATPAADPRLAIAARSLAKPSPVAPLSSVTPADPFETVRGGASVTPPTPAPRSRFGDAMKKAGLESPVFGPAGAMLAPMARGLVRMGGGAAAGFARLASALPTDLTEGVAPAGAVATPTESTVAPRIRNATDRLASAMGAPGPGASGSDRALELAGNLGAGALPFAAGPAVGFGVFGMNAAGAPESNTLTEAGKLAQEHTAPGSRGFDAALVAQQMGKDPVTAAAADLLLNLGMELGTKAAIGGGGALSSKVLDAIHGPVTPASAIIHAPLADRSARSFLEQIRSQGGTLDVAHAEPPRSFVDTRNDPTGDAAAAIANRLATERGTPQLTTDVASPPPTKPAEIPTSPAARAAQRIRAETAALLEQRRAAAAASVPVDPGAAGQGGGNGPATPSPISESGSAAGALSTAPTEIADGTQASPSHSSERVDPSSETSRTGRPSMTTTRSTTEVSSPGEANNFELGSIDPTSKRKVFQPTNDVNSLLALSDQTLPKLRQDLTDVTSDLEGAHVAGARAKHQTERGLARLHEKIAERGGQPQAISDYVGGRVWVDDLAHANTVVSRLEQRGYKVIENDDFLNGQGKDRSGYRARHMQLEAPSGLSVELQIQPRGVGEVQEPAHRLYDVLRSNTAPRALVQRLDAEGRRLFEEVGNQAHEIPHEPVTDAEIRQAIGPKPAVTGDHAVDASNALDYVHRFEGWYRTRVGLPEGAPALEGATGGRDMTTIGKRRFAVRYRAIEAPALIPSNDPHNSFAPRKDYPQEIQGRVYHGEAGLGARERVVEMAGKLAPDKLTVQSRSANGPPIVTRRGHVIVGNQRAMAQQLAYASGRGDKIRAQVLADGERLGLDPHELAQMQHPVIVREITDPSLSPDNHAQLAEVNQLSDIGGGKAKDPMLEAAGRARQVQRNPAVLEHLAESIGPDETLADYLRSPRGPALLDRMVKADVIQPNELDSYRDAATGKLTKFGRERIAEIVQSAAVSGDVQLLDNAPPAILGKLDQAWPKLVQAGNVDGWSLEAPLREALELHTKRVDNGMKSIADVLGQGDMFGAGAAAESKGVQLAKFLERAKKGDVTAALERYATAAADAKKGAAADDMFGHTPETPDQAFARAFEEKAAPAPKVEEVPTVQTRARARQGKRAAAEVVKPAAKKRRAGEIGDDGSLGTKMMGSIAGAGIGAAGGARAGNVGDTPEARRRNRILGAAAGALAGASLPWAPAAIGKVFAENPELVSDEGASIFKLSTQGDKLRLTIAGKPNASQWAELMDAIRDNRGSFRFSLRRPDGAAISGGSDPFTLMADLKLGHATARLGAVGAQPGELTPAAFKERIQANVGSVGADARPGPDMFGDLESERTGAIGDQPARKPALEFRKVTPLEGDPNRFHLKFVGEGEGGAKRTILVDVTDRGDGTLQVNFIGRPSSVASDGTYLSRNEDLNQIGAAGMRDVGRALKAEFPGVQFLEGNRINGAHARGGDQPLVRRRIGAIGVQPTPPKIPQPPTAADQAFSRASKSIDFTGRLAKAAGGSTRTLSSRIQRVMDGLANATGPLERLGQLADSRPHRDPGALLTYVKSSDGTAHEAIAGGGVLDPVTRKPIAPSLSQIFAPIRGNDADLERAITYLKAKRDVGRGLQGVGGDQQALDDAHEIVQFGDQDPTLSKIAQQWESFTDGIGNYAVKSGLWTPRQWDAMKASDALYVRYKRILDEGVDAAIGRGSGGRSLANVTSGVKSFTGSARAVSNPIEAMGEYARQIIHRSDRYRVGAAVFDALDDLGPEADLIGTPLRDASQLSKAGGAVIARAQAGAPNNVTEALQDLFTPQISKDNPVIWRNGANGRREYVQIHDAGLWGALMQMNATDGAVRKFLNITVRPLKRFFTATTTGLVPRFSLVTNPLRDIPVALAQTQAGLTPVDIVKGYAEATASLIGRSELAKEAQRFGLAHVSIFSQDLPHSARTVAPIGTSARAGLAAKRVVGAPVHGLEALGNASDLGPRLGEYMAAVKQNMKKVDAGEWSIEEARLDAARKGRGVTLDFSNQPGNAVLRLFGDYIPFFRVGLQGPTKFAQSAMNNPARVGSVAAAAGGAAAMAWFLKHQLPEEERQKINDMDASTRSGYLFVPTSPGGPVLKIPVAQELNVFVQGMTAALDGLYETNAHAGRLLTETGKRLLPSGLDAMIQGVIPVPGIQQVEENARNQKVFGDRPVEPRRMENLPPASRRLDTTSPTYDAIAAAVRAQGRVTGVGKNTSPLQAENVVRGLASTAAPLVTAATDPIASRLMGRARKPTIGQGAARNPLSPSSAILATDPPAATESERTYYAIKDKLEQGKAEQSRIAKTKDRDAQSALRDTYGQMLREPNKALVKETDDRLTALHDRADVIRRQFQNGTLEEGTARTQLDQLTTLRQRLVRRAVATLRARGVTP